MTRAKIVLIMFSVLLLIAAGLGLRWLTQPVSGNVEWRADLPSGGVVSAVSERHFALAGVEKTHIVDRTDGSVLGSIAVDKTLILREDGSGFGTARNGAHVGWDDRGREQFRVEFLDIVRERPSTYARNEVEQVTRDWAWINVVADNKSQHILMDTRTGKIRWSHGPPMSRVKKMPARHINEDPVIEERPGGFALLDPQDGSVIETLPMKDEFGKAALIDGVLLWTTPDGQLTARDYSSDESLWTRDICGDEPDGWSMETDLGLVVTCETVLDPRQAHVDLRTGQITRRPDEAGTLSTVQASRENPLVRTTLVEVVDADGEVALVGREAFNDKVRWSLDVPENAKFSAESGALVIEDNDGKWTEIWVHDLTSGKEVAHVHRPGIWDARAVDKNSVLFTKRGKNRSVEARYVTW